MTTYIVTAKRWSRGWELHIDGVGVTQARSLSVAESMAREYIAFKLDINDENSFDVDVVPELDADLSRQVRTAREQVRTAARQQQKAAAQQRDVARKLSETGLTGREIAAVLGMSPQRVSQLLSKSDTPGHKAVASSKAAPSASARVAASNSAVEPERP
ncbi:sigma-70 family RNA polymerase sigma factor [Haloechinothrix halophila]|uniref:hypothetical protein n=1 Tax=Haloechinothrix halophila TaxID=1069073 RepID=UPI0003F8F13D|nr:hypothetical protein [Haloechinothrix halophila]